MIPSINPKLKFEYYPVKYLKFSLPLLGILAFFSFFFYFIFSGKSITNENDSVLIFAPLVLMFFLIGIGFLLNVQEKKLLKYNDILNNTAPVKKWLNTTNIINFKGMVYLMTDNENQKAEEGEFVVIQVSKNKRLKKAPLNLSYYYNTGYDKKLLLFEDGRNIFTGFKLERQEAREQLEKSIKYTPLLAAVGGIAPFIIVIILAFQINNMSKLSQFYTSSYKWSNTEAEIITSKIDETSIKRGKRTITGYKNVVKYRYSVNNNEYVSDLISFDYAPFSELSEAENMKSYLDFEKHIKIFYNSKNPKQSYIIPANLKVVNNSKTTLIYAAIIVTVLGIFLDIFLVFYIKKVKAKQLNLQKSV